MTASVTIDALNEDTDNIHIFMSGEDFSPSNRVAAGAQMGRTGDESYTWATENSVVTVTVYAGRGGIVSDSQQVQMTGKQRMDGRRIYATWNLDQTLTASLGP